MRVMMIVQSAESIASARALIAELLDFGARRATRAGFEVPITWREWTIRGEGCAFGAE